MKNLRSWLHSYLTIPCIFAIIVLTNAVKNATWSFGCDTIPSVPQNLKQANTQQNFPGFISSLRMKTLKVLIFFKTILFFFSDMHGFRNCMVFRSSVLSLFCIIDFSNVHFHGMMSMRLSGESMSRIYKKITCSC